MLESNLTSTPVLFGEIQREILDVRKEEQDKVVEPTLDDIVVKPDSAMQTLGSVLVKGVTANIDENIKPENIKLGATILGVQGNVAPDKPDQEKTIYPSEEEQIVVADNGFELAKVIAKPVETETIEVLPTKEKQTINASEGKYIKQFEVLGVETEEINIVPTTEKQTFTPSENKFFDKVIIDEVEDLDPELTGQEELLAKLEEDVNALSDKPADMLQQLVDQTKSCEGLFSNYSGNNVDYISNLDVSQVTNMNKMFYQSKITSFDLPNFDTSSVTTMRQMFSRSELVSITTPLNMSNVTDAYEMFAYTDIKSTPLLDTKNATSMYSMFSYCYELEEVNITSTRNVKSFRDTFHNCRILTSIPMLDVSNATSMETTFWECHSLSELPLLNTENVTTFSSCFSTCKKLEEIRLTNTSKNTTCYNMFSGCHSLKSIYGKLDMINVTSCSGMFDYTYKLENVTLANIKKSLQIGSGTKWGHLLTNESLINTFKELWDLTGATSQKLTLSTTSKENIANIYVKLIDVTDEMRAEDEYIDNKKPCVVCESTDEGAMTLTEYAISKNWSIA